MQSAPDSPAEQVVQRQLEAYNARDLDAWLATYRDDARQYALHGPLLADGKAAIRARMSERFRDPALHAELLSRTVLGAIVVDHETVARSTPQGVSTQPMICIYEVRDGLIAQATFAVGPAHAPAPPAPENDR